VIDRTVQHAASIGTTAGARLRGAVRARVLSLWSRDLVPLRAPHAFVLRVARVATLVVRGIIAHQVKLLAAALTYYTVFSIVPLLVVVIWMLKALDHLPIIPAALPGESEVLSGNALLQEKARRILQSVHRTSAVTSGVVGLAALLYAVTRMFRYTGRALVIIAGGQQQTPHFWRLLGYVALVLLPPAVLLLSGLLLALTHGALGNRTFRVLASVPGLSLLAGAGVGLAGLWLALAIFYSASARARIAFSSALVGAAVAALVLPAVLWVFAALQIGASRAGALQSGLAAGPVFLLWLYASWYVVLLGAEIAVAHRVDRVLCHGAATFQLDCVGEAQVGAAIMIEVTRALAATPPPGPSPPLTAETLARELRLPPSLVRELCGRLVARGFLAVAPSGLTLGCNPDETGVEAVFDAMARDPGVDEARLDVLGCLPPQARRVLAPPTSARSETTRGPTVGQLAREAGRPAF